MSACCCSGASGRPHADAPQDPIRGGEGDGVLFITTVYSFTRVRSPAHTPWARTTKRGAPGRRDLWTRRRLELHAARGEVPPTPYTSGYKKINRHSYHFSITDISLTLKTPCVCAFARTLLCYTHAAPTAKWLTSSRLDISKQARALPPEPPHPSPSPLLPSACGWQATASPRPPPAAPVGRESAPARPRPSSCLRSGRGRRRRWRRRAPCWWPCTSARRSRRGARSRARSA